MDIEKTSAMLSNTDLDDFKYGRASLTVSATAGGKQYSLTVKVDLTKFGPDMVGAFVDHTYQELLEVIGVPQDLRQGNYFTR